MARLIGVPKQSGVSVVSNIKVVGIPQAVAKLQGADAEARLALGLAVMKAAQTSEEVSQSVVPVETGNLKSGIRAEKIGSYSYTITASSLAGNVGEKNTKEYAGFVENGTSKMAPRFFMRAGYEAAKPVVAIALQELARKLERL